MITLTALPFCICSLDDLLQWGCHVGIEVRSSSPRVIPLVALPTQAIIAIVNMDALSSA